MTRELVTAAELARQLGLSKQAISKKNLVPDGHSATGKPLYNLEKQKEILGSSLSIDAIKSNQIGLPKELKGGRKKSTKTEKVNSKKSTSPEKVNQNSSTKNRNKFNNQLDSLEKVNQKLLANQSQSGSIDIDLFKESLLGDDFEELPDDKKYLRARAVREAIYAAQAQIDLDKSRELLVTKESIKQQGAELGITLIGALTALPDRLSP